MIYTREQRKKVFDSLPEDLKEAIMSVETSEKLAKIREANSLMLDQAGELGDELGLFMLGLTKQVDFVKNLSKRLEIPYDRANKIATDINTDILDAVRTSLQKIQSRPEDKQPPQNFTSISIPIPTPPPPPRPTPPPIPINPIPAPTPVKPVPMTPIEKAGDFSIEREAPSNSPLYNDSNLKKESVLNDLENIDKLKKDSANAFVEHLLTTPVSNPQQITKKPAPPREPGSADPYREQF